MAIIGIDVSKAKLDVLWLKDPQSMKVKSKVFGNDPAGHSALLHWFSQQTGEILPTIKVVMEATSVYHEELAYRLFKAKVNVMVVNPAQVRFFAKGLGVKTKNDKKDSIILARYGATQPWQNWQPVPEDIRVLKALLTRLKALEADKGRETNRLEKNIAAHGATVVRDLIEQHIQQLEQAIDHVKSLIIQHIEQNPTLKKNGELLKSIKGVGPVISQYMLAVIHSRPFKQASEVAAFLGMVPIECESGSSVKGRPRLSKAGDPTVRAKLYMAAVVAIQHNPIISAHYQRLLKRGKSKMAALCAAMRKLIHICFGVIKHQTPFNPHHLEALNMNK